jgi:hypothetical protein
MPLFQAKFMAIKWMHSWRSHNWVFTNWSKSEESTVFSS